MSGPGSRVVNNLVLDHCFFGGGTDQTQLALNGLNNVTYIDCLFANPRGKSTTSRFHQYQHQIGTPGTSFSDMPNWFSMIGNVLTNGRERNPSSVAPTFAIANQLNYNRGSKSVDIRGHNSQTVDYFQNIVGVWDRRGPAFESNSGVIQIGRSDGSQSYGSGSQVYLSDNVVTTAPADEWDVVNDFDNQEGAVRSNVVVSSAWPDGLVAAQVGALSDADRLSLFTDNVGPRPNARITDIANLITGIVQGNDNTANDYAAITATNTSSTYSEPGSPHTAGNNPNRTVIEEDLLDKAEAIC
jgi:hypothetical protein